jgi:hypothetical protein
MPNQDIIPLQARAWQAAHCGPDTGRPDQQEQQRQEPQGCARQHDVGKHRAENDDEGDFSDALELLIEAEHGMRHGGSRVPRDR